MVRAEKIRNYVPVKKDKSNLEECEQVESTDLHL